MAQAQHFLDQGAYLELIDLLEPLVEANHEHIAARELLLKAYEALGQNDEAVDQLLALADYYSFDDPDTAERHLRRVLELDPENIEAKLQLKGTSPGAVIASIIPPALYERLEEELQDDSTDESIEGLENDLGDELDLNGGELRAPAVPSIELPNVVEAAELSEASAEPEPLEIEPELEHHALDQTSDQKFEPAADQAFDETFDEEELGGFDVDLDIELLEPISPEAFEALPVVDSPAEPEAALPGDQSEIEEILEEAEFYANQELLAEARETLLEGLEEFEGHPLLMERLAEIDAELAKAAEAAGAAGDELDETFALASKLAEQAPAQTPSSDAINAHEIFEQFKEGVAREIDEEDSATHFDLGIAYREMGLYDDAIREFELAGRAPLRTCNALTMIGLCHVDAGRYESAIEAFERALEAPHKLEGEIVGLHYEIGLAQSLRGEKSRAVEAFEKAAAIDPSFRDVSVRLEMLRGEGP